MSNLYIFSSPSQAYIFSKQITQVENAYLILTGDKRNSKKIMIYLGAYQWQMVYHVQEVSSKSFHSTILHLLKIKWLAQKIFRKHKVSRIFIGSINNFIQLVFLNLFDKRGDIFLMTDGMQQIIINELRKHNKPVLRELPKIFGLLGIKNKAIEKLNFLTPYQLYSTFDRVTYVPFKREKLYNIDSNIIAFIGMPVVELNFISKEFHLSILEKVIRKFPEKTMLYYSHPSEKRSNLECIEKYCKVVTLPKIFEEHLQTEINIPQTIISYYSSVLLNAHLMYDNLHVFYFKLSNLQRKDLAENLKFLYEYFDNLNNENFKEIKL